MDYLYSFSGYISAQTYPSVDGEFTLLTMDRVSHGVNNESQLFIQVRHSNAPCVCVWVSACSATCNEPHNIFIKLIDSQTMMNEFCPPDAPHLFKIHAKICSVICIKQQFGHEMWIRGACCASAHRIRFIALAISASAKKSMTVAKITRRN